MRYLIVSNPPTYRQKMYAAHAGITVPRLSIDKKFILLGYDETKPKPDCFEGITCCNESEIKEELAGPNWTVPLPSL